MQIWDNYCPYLYHAYVELRGEDGEILEIIPYDIGFRRLEMIDKVIYLNGKRLVITGVNRHEWSAKTGRSISMDEMTADIDCMIRNNINAVRTCHYPDQIPWYYLCDKAGIYVMAETNMESHGTFQKLGAIEPSCSVPCSIPQWREAVVDRARSNFETFKNHTAILFWSLGNESYAGDDIEAMNTYFKEKQDGRFVHYESSFYDRNYEETISDVESRMYAKPYEVEEYLNNNPKKPYLLCEYMHDMGNSMGGLGTYMKLIDKYEMYHGGFIWDFIDQALLVKDEVTGKEVLRYGGDFDERIKELRAARRMTRQQLAEQIGLSVDALRKIEAGVNGAKIDTLISIAELFHITLDYLVCGCERKAEVDDLLVGLKEKEVQFIRNMVLNAVDNMKLLTE